MARLVFDDIVQAGRIGQDNISKWIVNLYLGRL